jgi:hypothetical protein
MKSNVEIVACRSAESLAEDLLEHMARSTQADPWRLSTDIHIEKGDAPAAGFASAGDTDARPSHALASGSASDWTRLEAF